MVAHTNCSRCRRFRPIHAKGLCKPCYNVLRYVNESDSDDRPVVMARPGERGTCEECRREDTIHADGECYRCWKREQSQMTAEAVEALVDSQRPTMPREKEERREKTRPGPKPRYTRPELTKGYPQSPHGENCPLLTLVMRGEGGFTRGLIEADKYLREHPGWSRPVGASQTADGSIVRVRFANGETIQFPREKAVSAIKARRDAAAKCRLAIFAVLHRRGPLKAGQLAALLSHDAEYIRVAIRGSGGWFEKTQQTKDSAYRVTPKGIREYAALNHGKPLAGSKTKGRKLVKT